MKPAARPVLAAALTALALAAAQADALEATTWHLLRNPTDAIATLDQINPNYRFKLHSPHDDPLPALNLPVFSLAPRNGRPTNFLPGDPDSAARLDAVLDENAWHLRDIQIPPAFPQNMRIYSRDDATNRFLFRIPFDNHIILTRYEMPSSDIALLPSPPASVPAEGPFVAYFDDLSSRTNQLPFASFLAAFSSLSIGVATDGDTLVLHLVLVPPPDSPLADWLRAIPPVPPSTACLNLPDATATFALAPLPPFPLDLAERLNSPTALRLPGHALAAALFPPPSENDCLPGTLCYASVSNPASPIQTLDAWLGGLVTNRVHGNTVVYAPADSTNSFWNYPSTGDFLRDYLTWRRPLVVPLPSGLLLGIGTASPAPLDAAIDAALGTPPAPLPESPAFRTAFPAPDAPPIAILHADLRLLSACSSFLFRPDPAKLSADGLPLPLDAFAYVTPDASLAIRIRLPLAILPAL